ncbi:MAG TPA: GDSL-type esterase/lipase family protein, partial [Candidatus Omnitrophota bacterium]|nr:GDSL-type esterase/lipase family protein [Candidatus Omnitrophota bacterium]
DPLATAERVLAEARAWRPTLMVGPPPVGDCPATDARIQALSRDLAALCARLGIPYLPVFEELSADPTWRREAAADDGSHPDAGGYCVLAGLVAAWPAWRDAIR